MKNRHGDTETRRNRHGDTETRRHGEKISGLRVSTSAGRKAGVGHKAAGRASRSPSKSPRPPVSESPRPSSPRPSSPAFITLLTDFGLADYFVGAMKGVVLAANPNARLVDITHEISSHDIAEAAFTLLAAYSAFPPKTIHLAVVDPGVGSQRRPILVVTGDQLFVGPDNGIFSYVIDQERQVRVFHITNEKYFRHPVSPSFHGRDIFAPVAAALSLGARPEVFGQEISDPFRLAPLAPEGAGKGRPHARIIHIDRFGNCVTNLTQKELTPAMIKSGAQLLIKGQTITAFREFFADEGKGQEKLFAIWGSAGFLEIAAQNRSAAKVLKVERGDRVEVTRTSRP